MKEKKITDLDLINQFRNGSLDAFEELISRYESKVFNLALKFMRNMEDAEEVLQDVFSTLHQKLKSFEGKSAFSSWLYRIAVNAAFMKLRKKKQHTVVYLEDLPCLSPHLPDTLDNKLQQSTFSDAITYNHELREVIKASISKLPEQYQAVFILRDIDGLSNQEVGDILDLSIPAVKSRLHRSRLMLRKRLQKYYDEYIETSAPRKRSRTPRTDERVLSNDSNSSSSIHWV